MEGTITDISKTASFRKYVPQGSKRSLGGHISANAVAEKQIENAKEHHKHLLPGTLSVTSSSPAGRNRIKPLKGKVSSKLSVPKEVLSNRYFRLDGKISKSILSKGKVANGPSSAEPLHLITGHLQEQKKALADRPESANETSKEGEPNPSFRKRPTGKKSKDVANIVNHLQEHERILFVLGEDNDCYVYNPNDGAYHLVRGVSFSRFVIRSLYNNGWEQLEELAPSVLDTVFQVLQNNPPVLLEADELSPNDHLVNFRNGFVDLDDKLLHIYPHSPDRMMTSCLQADYVHNASPERFLKYLEFQWPDPTERERALDIMSLCISPLKRLKLLLFFVGKKDCGKSQIIETLTKIVGDEFSTPFKLGDFAGKFYIGEMLGKRLMYCADVDTTTPLKNVDVIKTATGRDTIIAEPKSKARSSFRAVSIFLFAGNDPPNLGKHSSDPALIDRFAFLLFPHPVPKEDQIDAFGEVLFREEGDEIASFLADHLHNLAKRKFRITPSASANEAMDTLRRGNPLPALNEYIDTRLILAPGQVISCQEAYKRYQSWAQSNNHPTVAYIQFRDYAMSRLPAIIEKARPHHTRDENNVACFIGVAYANNEE